MQPTSFFRRIAAVLYDSLIVLAILMIATLVLLPFTQGQAIESGNFYYQGILLFLMSGYFVFFWVKRGQTIGMSAWRIRLVTQKNQFLTIQQAYLRFMLAALSLLCFGLGWLWCGFNRDRSTLYDRICRTRLIQS